MKKLEQQYTNLAKSKGNFDLGFKKSAKEMENKLKRMGIELPQHGPRISDPAHTRDTVNSYSSSSCKAKC